MVELPGDTPAASDNADAGVRGHGEFVIDLRIRLADHLTRTDFVIRGAGRRARVFLARLEIALLAETAGGGVVGSSSRY